MNLTTRQARDVTILEADGRITANTSDRAIVKAVRDLLRQGRKQFLLNLAAVPYVDSTGLADILEAYTTTKRQGGVFKLERLSPHVRELLEITALLTVFEAYPSEAEALASFESGNPLGH